ncbi:MAG: GlxA family transcriptional regulator [Rhodospirillales bacterium]|nr:GlxA family transcriptional regulator [Rhodospirillales bacterium]
MTHSDIPMSESDLAPKLFGFLLIPGFALLAYASAVEPLRAANILSGRRLYDWCHLSPDGGPVAASNGLVITPDMRLEDAGGLDTLIICAGGNPAAFRDRPTLGRLRRLARQRLRLGGVSGGPYILARAGLLHGYRFTLHWEHAESFGEDFPELDLRRSLFEIDRDRLTCSGGTAPLDMMHALIARDHGAMLARRVSEWFLQTQIREGANPQRMAPGQRLGVSNRVLAKVLEHMEGQGGAPASRDTLAALGGVSVRQLERLFRRHLGSTLGAHDRRSRLERARMLLRQTGLSVLEVALASGFASGSHFSRAYRKAYGHPPNAERGMAPGQPAPAP